MPNLTTELDPDDQRIGQVLRDLRTSRNWDVADLADKVGRSRPNLSNIEAGRRKTDITLLRSIARAYDLSLGSLAALLYPSGHEMPRPLVLALEHGPDGDDA